MAVRSRVLLLALAVLAVYSPSLSGGFLSVDDGKMIDHLANTDFSWRQLFAVGGNLYYRPLLMLTFWFDKWAWGLEPSFMHLENVLLHLGNGLLVYALAARVYAAYRPTDAGLRLLPLVCALLFALHPVNTESVNWVSGRTDLLATFFVLAALLLLLRARECDSAALAFTALVLMVCGVISKEVTIFFIPPAAWLLWRWPQPGWNQPRPHKALWVFTLPFLCAVVFYGVRRWWKFGLDDPAFNYIANSYRYDLIDTVRVSLKVIGFYGKKLFFPWPLNFAITNVSNYYVVVGILAVIGTVMLLRRRQLCCDLLTTAIYLLSPAVLIALTAVAWTNLAERYLYLPAAFFVVGLLSSLLLTRPAARCRRYLLPAFLLVLVSFGTATAQRNRLWADPVAFYQDLVAKSPNYAPAHNELALALKEAKRFGEAREHLLIAQRLTPPERYPQPALNEVLVLIESNAFEQAHDRLDALLVDIPQAPTAVLETSAKFYEALGSKSLSPERQENVMEQLRAILVELHRRTGDPFLSYRLGKFMLTRGDDRAAADYFAEAARYAPKGAHYKQAAEKLAARLTPKTGE